MTRSRLASAAACGLGACQMTVADACGGGLPTCTPGEPTAETCNNIDDDCDGVIDDGLGQTQCGTGACFMRIDNCVDGEWQTCVPGEPSPETCNNIDDDCNLLVDDGLGQTTCGVGACEVTVENCLNGVSQTCVPGEPSPETCNGIVDDGDPGGGAACGTTDVGECAIGTTQCVDGSLVCIGGVEPTAEICDGLDNDCDGAIDNVAAPGMASLVVDLAPSATRLSWGAIAEATGYDVVSGDLRSLLESAGDFQIATTACLADDTTLTSLDVPALPAPGEVIWFLIRAVNCGGGTYDSPGILESRDAEIDASAASCP